MSRCPFFHSGDFVVILALYYWIFIDELLIAQMYYNYGDAHTYISPRLMIRALSPTPFRRRVRYLRGAL